MVLIMFLLAVATNLAPSIFTHGDNALKVRAGYLALIAVFAPSFTTFIHATALGCIYRRLKRLDQI
jgi:hypothetical protein